MRYMKPSITGTFTATSTIHGVKITGSNETGTDFPSQPPAYEADE